MSGGLGWFCNKEHEISKTIVKKVIKKNPAYLQIFALRNTKVGKKTCHGHSTVENHQM
jgi:hypothetical protein